MNHRANAIFSACAVLLGIFGFWVAPKQKKAEQAQTETVLEAPVPLDDVATDAGAIAPQDVRQMLMGKLPPPAENQKKAGQCEPPEEEINGGCWMQAANFKPPCDPPEGKRRRMWPHDGKCWVPWGPTAKLPTSGGSQIPAIAE